MWSEMPITTLMSCSISRIAISCSLRMSSRRRFRSSDSRGLRPAAGSSRQSSTRLGAHGAGDLEAALGAIGQVTRRIIGAVDEPGHFEPVLGKLHRLSVGADIGRGIEDAGKSVTRGDASGCCAARPSGFRERSCRRTGGYSGRCVPPWHAARCGNRPCAQAGTPCRRDGRG